MQLISVYVMLSLYIFIISLAAVSVMAYVRSISVATDNNKGLFESLTKLGADTRYKKNILKKQIARIVQYPGVIGCVLGFVFAFVMNFMNDGMINGVEAKALTILAGMLLGMGTDFCMLFTNMLCIRQRKLLCEKGSAGVKDK